jgi:hypothetical protein
MRHPALLLPVLALVAGCAAPAADPVETPVRFAVIAAPMLAAADTEGEELSPEDALLEVVTQLSVEESMDFILVPGPLLTTEDEDLRLGLIGALGSLAGELVVALGPEDGPQADLLEAFEEQLLGHDGELAYKGKRVGPVRPAALDPDGHLPTDKEPDAPTTPTKTHKRWILVQGGLEPPPAGLLVVRAGPAVRLEANEGSGAATLELPSIAKPPHIYAIAELRDGLLTVHVHSVLDAELAEPTPIRLIR